MQRIVLTLIGIAAAIGPLLITIGKIATGVGTLMTLAPKIVSAIKLVRTGMASFNAVLLANPIALVVAAVALLSATFVYLWKTNAKFRNGIITIWNSLKAYTTKVWSSIRKLAVTTWGAIKSAVLSPVRAIRSSVTSSWAALRSTTARVWNGIKSAMLTPINSARDRIRGIINSIRGFFPMRIGNIFSDLRLPHIHVQGGKAPFGIGGKGSLPKFSVDWYAKAMKNGMILNSPTIFGMSSSSLLAGGEAGSETVVGTESLMNMIRAAVSGVGNDVANAVLTANRIALSGASSSDIHLDVYLFKNGPKMGEEIVHAYDTYKRRLG
jgi:hypothetical protein